MSRNAILTQVTCLVIILLACLSLGFGSWLETNNLHYLSSSSVSRQLSVFRINLISTNNLDNSIHLTFGLWRYCVSNDLNSFNACSPIQINFDIDTFAAIKNILPKNYNQLPLLPIVSYVRVIPLLLATFFGVISFGISLFLLPSNNKKSVQRKALLWLNSVLCLFSAALTSVSFGVTVYQYSSNIKEVCSTLKAEYICQSYTPGLEIILLGLAIGLFTVSSLYCFFIASLSSKLSSKTEYQNSSRYSFYASTNEGTQSNRAGLAESQQPNMTETADSMDESIAFWNINKERLSLRPPPPNNNHKQHKAGCRSSSDNNSPLKDEKKVTNLIDSKADLHSVKPHLVASGASLATTTLMASTRDINFTSSSSLDQDVLRPPTLPFANNSRPKSSNHSKDRPLSYDSSNTFGAFQSGPNSPAGDECSMNSASSYMDYQYQRSDSVVSRNNSHLMYATSATGGTQSNHTLGAFSLHHTNTRAGSENYVLYNSSYEEDGEKYPASTLNISNNNSTTDSIDNPILPIPDERKSICNNTGNNAAPSPTVNNDQLHKRINDYLQKR